MGVPGGESHGVRVVKCSAGVVKSSSHCYQLTTGASQVYQVQTKSVG